MQRPPDIAVEILSKDQSRVEMRRKVAIYRALGVPAVWVFDPERSGVDAYEDGVLRTLSGGDVLTSQLVPGFRHRILDRYERRAKRG